MESVMKEGLTKKQAHDFLKDMNPEYIYKDDVDKKIKKL